MFQVKVTNSMFIAHSLPDESFGPAQNLHGATYTIDLFISSNTLGDKNIVIDKKRFKVPKGYFNTLINNSIEKNQLKSNRFKVPVKYFETIDKQQIYNKIYIDKVKYIRVSFYTLTAIAAMFIGIIFLPNYLVNNSNDFSSDEIINYVNNNISNYRII
mgnify:CR=1 FL=1